MLIINTGVDFFIDLYCFHPCKTHCLEFPFNKCKKTKFIKTVIGDVVARTKTAKQFTVWSDL